MKQQKAMLCAWVIFHFTALNLIAQLHDKNWVLGNYYLKPSILSFTTDSLEIIVPDSLALAMDVPHQISNKDGELAFYTNGCAIANRDHKIMVNGDQINPGKRHDNYCKWYSGYPLPFAKMALPWPGHDNVYKLYHMKITDTKWFVRWLLETTVDMNLENGLGAVTEKNKIVEVDSSFDVQIDAVKHGNGRDWWVITTDNDTAGQIYLNRLTPDGFTPRIVRQIEPPKIQGSNWGMAFSPDGSRFAVNGTWGNNYLTLADFDRCTGEFSNVRKIPYTEMGFPASQPISIGGLAFSPNSRYLYSNMDGQKMYQIDTDTDLVVEIGEFYFDSIAGTLPAHFFAPQLAMNGKIYIGTTNTTKAQHIIHNPDLPAPDCNFEQYGLILHYSVFLGTHMPNFRLYELAGSPCDSLTVNTKEPQKSFSTAFSIMPNPASDEVGIQFSEPVSEPMVQLFDPLGRLVWEKKYPFSPIVSLHIPLGQVANGNYFLVVRSLFDGKMISTRQLIVRKQD